MSYAETSIIRIICGSLGCEESSVTRESTLHDLGADSLDRFVIFVKMEEAFGVVISDDAAENIVTVGDAIRFVTEFEGTRGGFGKGPLS